TYPGEWIDVPNPPANLVVARRAGAPFGVAVARSTVHAPPVRVVLVAETSAALNEADRERQHAQLARFIDAVPAATRLALLSGDWVTGTLVRDATPRRAAEALDQLDAVVSAGAL